VKNISFIYRNCLKKNGDYRSGSSHDGTQSYIVEYLTCLLSQKYDVHFWGQSGIMSHTSDIAPHRIVDGPGESVVYAV